MKHINLKKGAMLAEFVVACAIFTVVVLALLGLIDYAVKHWGSVQDRNSVQMSLQRACGDICDSLEKTNYQRVYIYQPADDYRHALVVRTYINPKTGKFEPRNPKVPSTGMMQTDTWGYGYILYFLVRPKDDPCNYSYNETDGEDKRCPHKILVRVDLTRNDNQDQVDKKGAAFICWEDIWCTASKRPDIVIDEDGQTANTEWGITNFLPGGISNKQAKYFNSERISLEEYLNSLPASADANASGVCLKNYVNRVSIVGKNILSFNVEKNTEISFDIPTQKAKLDDPNKTPSIRVQLRAFKLWEARQSTEVGVINDLTGNVHTVEINTEVIPQLRLYQTE